MKKEYFTYRKVPGQTKFDIKKASRFPQKASTFNAGFG
jgi:hypothetical protein